MSHLLCVPTIVDQLQTMTTQHTQPAQREPSREPTTPDRVKKDVSATPNVPNRIPLPVEKPTAATGDNSSSRKQIRRKSVVEPATARDITPKPTGPPGTFNQPPSANPQMYLVHAHAA